MTFDAREAKLLQPGTHLTIENCPGLRLEASAQVRSWTYRYRSPVDGRMRQVRIGRWPAMSFHAAAAGWEKLRAQREAGEDPAMTKRADRNEARVASQQVVERRRQATCSVREVCDDFLAGHIDRHRKARGAAEVRRMFDTMLSAIADVPAALLTRAQAFELLEAHQDIPVQAAKLRAELGAAWDYALDAGRLPDSTPNWWRQIMRGRLRSKGKTMDGQRIGPVKRALSSPELADLILWLPNFSRPVQDVLTLYLWTLARGAEIVAMEAREISQEADGWWWTVPKAKTKNARYEGATDFRVPLVGRALEVVRRRLALHSGYLFPSRGAAGHTQQALVQTADSLAPALQQNQP